MELQSLPAGVDSPALELSAALARYREGESRKTIFRDLVRGSIRKCADGPSVLDIGCGHGFDGDADLQRSIADEAARFIGIEPDPDIVAPDYFTEVHHSTFEDAALQPGSVDVAYSAFVLEHVERPLFFWRKLSECLAPGGVFWGFTVDARHLFSLASLMAGKLRLKDRYLDWLRGRRGTERYENYKTFYRCNSPGQVKHHTRMFRRADFLSLHRVGQLNYYFPRMLWPPLHWAERLAMRLRLPGSVLVVRLEK